MITLNTSLHAGMQYHVTLASLSEQSQRRTHLCRGHRTRSPCNRFTMRTDWEVKPWIMLQSRPQDSMAWLLNNMATAKAAASNSSSDDYRSHRDMPCHPHHNIIVPDHIAHRLLVGAVHQRNQTLASCQRHQRPQSGRNMRDTLSLD